jgi:hypothetical protein
MNFDVHVRFPFLLLDRVIEYKAGEYAVAIKNVTINDEFFQGHFPDNPIMPGVLMIEVCTVSISLNFFPCQMVFTSHIVIPVWSSKVFVINIILQFSLPLPHSILVYFLLSKYSLVYHHNIIYVLSI